MRKLIANILRVFGAKDIHYSSNTADAIREVRASNPDIVFTEWRVQPLDGMEFTKLIRTGSDSPNPYVPIIMVTGHTERQFVMQARDAGITEFLAKPVSARTVINHVCEVVEKPRPFVRTKTYFGPDRRRKTSTKYRGPERRKADAETTADGLSQDAIDSLFVSEEAQEG